MFPGFRGVGPFGFMGPVQLPTGLPDRIERTDILGGLIHEYHAVAA